MSTAPTPHPLLSRFREAVATEEFLTHEQIAEQIGVSTRTVAYWMNAEVTPQKRYRRAIAEWLDARSGELAA